MFFVALSIVLIAHIGIRALGAARLRHALLPFYTLAVVFLSGVSIWWYFGVFTPMYRYGGPNALVTTSIGHYVQEELDADWQLVFLGQPRMDANFGTLLYLADDIERIDVGPELVRPFDTNRLEPDKGAVFVFLPERRDELDLVRETFPDGEIGTVASPVPDVDEPLYILYRVPAEQIAP
jgi:hypothetical protein